MYTPPDPAIRRRSLAFAEHCNNGKMQYVKKWIDHPDVDINYEHHRALRNAIRERHIDIVKLIIGNSKLISNFEGFNLLNTDVNGKYVILTPFTYAIQVLDYEILDIMIASNKFNIYNVHVLDMLLAVDNAEMNAYFLNQIHFNDYVINHDPQYLKLLPQEAKDIFLF